MIEIVATDEQARTLATSTFPVIVKDASGKVLGQLVSLPQDDDFTAEEIAEIKKRAGRPGPRFTTAEVLAHLRSLAPE